MNFFKKKHSQIFFIWLIFFAASFFSSYKLTESPAVWYDEGFYEQAAMNVAQRGIWGIQTSPESFASLGTVTAGFPLIGPVALAYKIFGIGVLQARAVMVIFILGLIATVFLFAKREYGYYAALGSAALLTSYSALYGNGKTVLGEVPGLFYFVCFLLFSNKWFRTGKKSDALFAGILFGLAISSKLSFLLAGLPMLIVTFLVFYKKFIAQKRASVLFMIGVLFPMLIWFVTQFDGTDTVTSFIETTFQHYEGPSGGVLLLQNMVKLFTEISPFYLFISCTIWMISLVHRTYVRINISVGEFQALVFTIFNIGIYLLSPGWYRYFFPAQVVILIFLPMAIKYLFDLCGSRIRLFARYGGFLSVSIVVLLTTIQTYQTVQSSFVASYYKSKRTEQTATAFGVLDTGSTYFVYNLPEVVIFLPHDTVYFQYMNSHPRYAIGRDQLVVLEKGIPDRVIINAGTYNQNKDKLTHYVIQQQLTDRYMILAKKLDE